MVRLISFLLLAFGFSCTIIEDSDITSQEEYDKLVLKSIEIKQETIGGTNTSTAEVTTTETANIPVSVPPFNGTVTRRVWMDWPSLSDKLKLKSGVTTSFQSYTSYLSTGEPWTFYLFQMNGSDTIIFELYRFRYDANGRLSTIITDAPYIENTPPTSKDTLIYGNTNNTKELTSIIRNPNGSPATFTLASTGGSIYQESWTFDFQGSRYAQNCQESTCGGTWGGNYDVFPVSGGFPVGVMSLTTILKGNLTLEDKTG